MRSTWACPSCARQLTPPDHLKGTTVRCPGCGAVFPAHVEPEPTVSPTPVVLRATPPPASLLQAALPVVRIRADHATPPPSTLAATLAVDEERLRLDDPVADLFGYRGFAARVMLAVCAVGQAASLTTSVMECCGVAVLSSEGGDWLARGLLLFNLLVLVSTCVFFCMWIYRAHDNLPLLRSPGLEYTPTWAVVAFFVPILNLFRPYQITQEIWKASDPDMPLRSWAWRDSASAGLIAFWWAFLLLSGFVGRVGARMMESADSLDAFRRAAAVNAMGDALSVLAAICAIILIQQIERRQARRLQRVMEEAGLLGR